MELDFCKPKNMYPCITFGTLFFLLTRFLNLACFLLLTSVCGHASFNIDSGCNSFQLYYSDEISMMPVTAIEGKCEVRKKQDIQISNCPAIFDHIFFCEHLYDPEKGAIKKVIIFLFLGVYLKNNN